MAKMPDKKLQYRAAFGLDGTCSATITGAANVRLQVFSRPAFGGVEIGSLVLGDVNKFRLTITPPDDSASYEMQGIIDDAVTIPTKVIGRNCYEISHLIEHIHYLENRVRELEKQ